MITDEIINKIRQSNDIVDVIGSYLPLTQRGKNFFAVCPFHSDHTPSMSISPDKQIFRCFTCKKTGNVITFVMDYENVSFVEALKILGERIGIKITNPKIKTISKEFEMAYQINDIVASFYKNNLESNIGAEAREYLNKRGLNKEIIKEFDIGLSDTSKLYKTLSKTYDVKLLEDLDIIRKQNESYVDVFQNRIMFPIKDENGNVVAFSGRIYKSSSDSKYVNSKETFIFKKSNILYNYCNAKEHIRREKSIIICEGFMDVIRLSSIGYKNAVALMGTSFTDKHFELIQKQNIKIILNLDQDSPGKSATLDIGNMLLKNKIDSEVIIFSEYKDSDELVLNKGKEAFDSAFNNRISFIDFKLNYLKKDVKLSDSVELTNYIKTAIDSINELDDDILKEIKAKALAKEFDISESTIMSRIKKTDDNSKLVIKEKKEDKVKKINKYDISEMRILYYMLNNEDAIRIYEKELGYLVTDEMSDFASKIIDYRIKNGKFVLADFISSLQNEKNEYNTYLKIMNFNQIDDYDEVALYDYIDVVKEYFVKQQLEILNNKLKNTLDIEEKKELLRKIENIKKEVLKW